MKKYLIFGLLLTVTWSMNAQKKELRAVSKALGKANFAMGINMAAASTVVSNPKIFMTGDSCMLVISTFYVDVARCHATF